ncbi:GLUG motif-containing protein [Thioalkalivibrio sp. ALMg13-2]|uniref:GLUG motif-containing protein n=1 Tax=Thioalkalivibrio sp. ALMg13-2 TaxID=1158167 RepID=UPI0003812853|nr:GLUG motif-containing protein [Thioalkalivibrio sp. ALMg13-2]
MSASPRRSLNALSQVLGLGLKHSPLVLGVVGMLGCGLAWGAGEAEDDLSIQDFNELFEEAPEAPWQIVEDAVYQGDEAWVRLTENVEHQVGALIYDQAFERDVGVDVAFRYYMEKDVVTDADGPTDDHGADGLAFFLFDGSHEFSGLGPSGGALGYGRDSDFDAAENDEHGLPHAYMGLGFDLYGGFTRGEGPYDTGNRNQVTLRGPGHEQEGYRKFASEHFWVANSQYVDVRVILTDEQRLLVFVRNVGDGATWSGTDYWGSPIIDIDYAAVIDAADFVGPDTLKFGFAAATGGLTNVHAVEQVALRTVSDLPTISEEFASEPEMPWDFGGGDQDSFYDASNEHLVLTEAVDNQVGYLLYDRAFTREAGLDLTFSYTMEDPHGADGLSFFLMDGLYPVNGIGPRGEGLGYKNTTGNDGLPRAVLGLGFDRWGNFSDDPDPHNAEGTTSDHVVLRGSGHEQAGYAQLEATPFAEMAGAGERLVNVVLSQDQLLTVKASTDDGETWVTLFDAFDLGPNNTGPHKDAEILKFGFAASTGGSNNLHAINWVSVNAESNMEVSARAEPTDGGAVTGAGIYNDGDEARLNAIPEKGNLFIEWRENGAAVSVEPEYSFTVDVTNDGESRDLVAHFEPAFAAGEGSAENPYEIADWEQLHRVRDYLDHHFVLTADLDADAPGYDELASATANGGAGWQPVGQAHDNYFRGSLDGQGYRLEGLRIDRSAENAVGLFGRTGADAEIANLTLADAAITGDSDVGGLIGYAEQTQISNTHVDTANVTGSGNYVGGLAGRLETSSAVTDSTASADVVSSGDAYVGGLVGFADVATITDSHASGSLTLNGNESAGGLIGEARDATIARSSAAVDVNGPHGGLYNGGLVGLLKGGEIRESHATGSVTGAAGGAGGLVGYVWQDGRIIESHATGTVLGDDYVGGLVGWLDNGQVTDSFAANTVDTGAQHYGGLTGNNAATVTRAYYDRSINPGMPDESTRGLTTSQLSNLAVFDGWDMTAVPGLAAGYPVLAWTQEATYGSTWVISEQVLFDAGDGSEQSPYVVSMPEQLDRVADDPTAHYVLADDLDFAGTDWQPIGSEAEPFTGSLSSEYGEPVVLGGLDGRPLFDVIGPGAEVSDLVIEGSVNAAADTNSGLLANAIEGTPGAPAMIDNVTIDSTSSIDGGTNDYIGGLAGTISHAELSAVTIDGAVTGRDYVGGVGGDISDSGLADTTVNGKTTGRNDVGGVGGRINNGKLIRTEVNGDTEGNGYVGGVGGTIEDSELSDTTVNGGVQGSGSNVGSVGGQINRSENANCVLETIRANGSVSGGNKTGGVGGSMDGCSVSDAEVAGDVTGGDDTGGVGGTITDGDISAVTVDGDVAGDDRVGGIGGTIDESTVDNVTVNGNVSGDSNVGPIGGQITDSEVTNEAVTGQVSQPPTSGDGTAGSPYVIDTAEQLAWMHNEPQAHYELNSDIDVSQVDWQPVGSDATPFTGSLKGDKEGEPVTLSGLDGKPLFDELGPGAEVSDLTIEGSINDNADEGSGLLANRIQGDDGNPVRVDNVTIDGGSRIDGGESDSIGGLAGTIEHGELNGITVDAEVNGGDGIGGIGGTITDSEIRDSTVNGNVEGSDRVGGVGGTITDSTIENVAVHGNVSGDSNVGGIGGHITDSEVSNETVTGQVSQPPTSGDGTAGSPYVIDTAEQLAWMHNEPQAHYELNSDIDLSQVDWQPVGSETTPFIGSLKGDTGAGEPANISGLDGKPLFDELGPGAEVSDLTIEGSINDNADEGSGLLANRIQGDDGNPVRVDNVTIDGGSRIDGGESDSIGGLAGTIEHGELNGTTVDAEVKGRDYVGGIGGQITNSTISDATVTGDVEGRNHVGGVGGEVDGSTVNDTTVTGDVTGTGDHVGGIGGGVNDSEVRDGTVDGNVEGNDRVGGVGGEIRDSDIRDTTVSGDVTGSGDHVGGIGGFVEGGTTENVDVEGEVTILPSIVGEDGEPLGDQSIATGQPVRFQIPSDADVVVDGNVTRGGATTDLQGGIGIYPVLLRDADDDVLRMDDEGYYVFEAQRGGLYALTFDGGETFHLSIEFEVRPQVAFSSTRQLGTYGEEVEIRAVLEGTPGQYPVVVPYTLSGVYLIGDSEGLQTGGAGLLATGEFTFAAGEHERIRPLKITPNADTGTIGITLTQGDGPEHAVLGDPAEHVIELRSAQEIPLSVRVTVEQGTGGAAEEIADGVVQVGEGDVTLSVTPGDAGTYSYDWNGSDPNLGFSGNGGHTITITDDANGLEQLAGDGHGFQVTVTDGARRGAALGRLRVVETIPDEYQEAIRDRDEAHRLPICPEGTFRLVGADHCASSDREVMLATPEGYSIRMGDTSERVSWDAGRFGTGIHSDDLHDGGGNLALNRDDPDFEHLGYLVDFEVFDLQHPGQSVPVVIPLADDESIPADATWRKWHGADGWKDFVQDDANRLHSAARSGDACPWPGSDRWEAGLNESYHCVRLILEDGGPNDLSGNDPNGVIADPGTLAVPAGAGGDEDAKLTSGGGGAFGGWLIVGLAGLLLAARMGRGRGVRRRLSPGAIGGAVLLVPGLLLAPVTAQAGAGSDKEAHPWYVGGQLGYARTGGVSSSSVTGDMERAGIAGSARVSDRTRGAWRLFGGYHFTEHFGLEGGYTDLGEITTRFRDVDAGLEVDDLEGIRPTSGRGLELVGTARWAVHERIDVFARAGVWHWQARYNLRVGSERERRTVYGTSGVIGAGASWHWNERWSSRLSVDRYRSDGSDHDFFGIGLVRRY